MLHAGSVRQGKVNCGSYVEMLEKQQAQLVAGLQQLYTRLQNGQPWPGQPLREIRNGCPLTHDILKRLNLLDELSGKGSTYDDFKKGHSRIQGMLLDRGAPSPRRRRSVSLNSAHDHTPSTSSYGGTPTTRQFPSSDAFSVNNVLSTPLMDGPFLWKPQMVSSTRHESPMVISTFMCTSALDPSALSKAAGMDHGLMLMNSPMSFNEPIYQFENYSNYDQRVMVNPTSISSNEPMISDWDNTSNQDFNCFIYNPVGA
jgi:hypothetical protein